MLKSEKFGQVSENNFMNNQLRVALGYVLTFVAWDTLRIGREQCRGDIFKCHSQASLQESLL